MKLFTFFVLSLFGFVSLVHADTSIDQAVKSNQDKIDCASFDGYDGDNSNSHKCVSAGCVWTSNSTCNPK